MRPYFVRASAKAEVETATHFLNKRWLPVVGNLLSRTWEEKLAARWGWHLWIYARKGESKAA